MKIHEKREMIAASKEEKKKQRVMYCNKHLCATIRCNIVFYMRYSDHKICVIVFFAVELFLVLLFFCLHFDIL